MPDVLVVPPFRTPLLTANGVPLSALDSANGDKSAGGPPGSRTTIETTRDWWLYWRTLAEFANAGLNMLTYGNSFDRPDAGGMPDGAIYVNADQSGVIYQNQGGEWHYIAGTMYGTLSPDQRPADLGANDAGFDFRSIDSDPTYAPREYIWSGTQWVEATLINYGAHSARPPADSATPPRSIYVENDRSGVIYQQQANAWHFLAGTMWGTLSPDQRPTDLGVNDAGFTFRGTDQVRAFVWSGSAWVETTPVTGVVNLTHPNVVTKVGATAGQIVEGGITDLSAANSNKVTITAAGNVGIGIASAGAKLHCQDSVAASYLAHFCTDDGNPANQKLALVSLGLSASQRFAAICGMQTAANNYNEGDFVVFTETGGGLVEHMRLRNSGALVLPNLPSSNPGAGSKQLWYDPADGNRVKFAP